jgi:hypothetical protein
MIHVRVAAEEQFELDRVLSLYIYRRRQRAMFGQLLAGQTTHRQTQMQSCYSSSGSLRRRQALHQGGGGVTVVSRSEGLRVAVNNAESARGRAVSHTSGTAAAAVRVGGGRRVAAGAGDDIPEEA